MPNEISPSVERSAQEGVTYLRVVERASGNPYDIPKSIFPLGPTTVCHLIGFILAIVLFVVCGIFIRIELNRIDGDGSVVMFHGLFGALCFAAALLLVFCTCCDVRWGFTRRSEWRTLFRRASAACSRNSRRQNANSESRRQEDIESQSLRYARAGKDSEDTESASEEERAEAGKPTSAEVPPQPSQENEPESELLSSGELRRRNLNLNPNELPPDSSNSSDEEPKGLRT